MSDLRNFKDLQTKIGVEFSDESLLTTAFTHRSYVNEHSETKEHNERLEFLGDAVLELIVSELLFSKFPGRPEGELTSFRSAMVKTTSLASVARAHSFGEYLLMSKGEEATGGRDKDYLLANTFEALLGAIYLDKGYEVAKLFVTSHLTINLDEIVEKRLDIDNKSKFQEVAQRDYKITPVYRVLSEEGPDHVKMFKVGVYLGNELYGTGEGGSKQRAEEDAAKKALKKLETEKS